MKVFSITVKKHYIWNKKYMAGIISATWSGKQFNNKFFITNETFIYQGS